MEFFYIRSLSLVDGVAHIGYGKEEKLVFNKFNCCNDSCNDSNVKNTILKNNSEKGEMEITNYTPMYVTYNFYHQHFSVFVAALFFKFNIDIIVNFISGIFNDINIWIEGGTIPKNVRFGTFSQNSTKDSDGRIILEKNNNIYPIDGRSYLIGYPAGQGYLVDIRNRKMAIGVDGSGSSNWIDFPPGLNVESYYFA